MSNKQLLAVIPQSMNECKIMGKEMSAAHLMLPEHLRNKPQDCMAVAMVAAGWGMNPFMVAQKTHIVSGKLGYEAQLVNAVISSSNSIEGRIHYDTVGDWSKIAKKNWLPAEENGLGVKVGAIFKGESEITWADTVYLAPVLIRNSPVWKSQPLVQLKYLALKYFARLYMPDVIMGVYDREELEAMDQNGAEPVNITPSADELNANVAKAAAKAAEQTPAELYACVECGDEFDGSEINDDGVCWSCEKLAQDNERAAKAAAAQAEIDEKAEAEAKAAAVKAEAAKTAAATKPRSQRDRRTAMLKSQGEGSAPAQTTTTTDALGKVTPEQAAEAQKIKESMPSALELMRKHVAQGDGKGYKAAKAIYDTATPADKKAIHADLMALYTKLKKAANKK